MSRRRLPLYEPYISFEGFDEAERQFNGCADERFFASPRSCIDCDFCPVREECLRFWKDYVVAEPLRPEEKERYLGTVTKKMRRIRRRKHERKPVFQSLG